MWNPWKHLRLAGAVVVFASCFVERPTSITLVFIGLLIQYIGVVAGIDRVERLIDFILEDKEKHDETDA